MTPWKRVILWKARRPGRAAVPWAVGRRVLVLAALLPCLVVLLALTGCTHSCLPGQCDAYHTPMGLPPALEHNPDPFLIPEVRGGADPATVADPDRPPRFISLQECFALALENGSVGATSLESPGRVSEDLAISAAGGGGVFTTDNIRVLAMSPAIVAARLEGTLARFDPIWSTGMSWNKVDEPVQGFSNFNNGMNASFSTTLAKPLSSGGVAGISFNTDYRLLANPPTGVFGVLNPSYTTNWLIGVEQPLLRGFGSEINQLAPAFPGSRLFPGLNNRLGIAAQEGILVTRLRFDQQRAEFERLLQFMILNVEAAYWRLYGSYVDLYAAEQGLRQAHAAWSIGKAQVELGKIDPSQFALLRAQFEQFRAQRLSALGSGVAGSGGVLDNERRLRILLGLPSEDGTRLVPIDAPSLTPYEPNWKAALWDTLTQRPELLLARKEVEVRHRNLLVQENNLLPDLRAQMSYAGTGLGTRLDGSGDAFGLNGVTPNGSLANLIENRFNNWTIGLTLNVPLGYRAENAAVREARLGLAQSYYSLKDLERRAETVLAAQYSRLIENYKLIEIRKLAREALAEQLEVRFRKYAAGAKDSTLEFLLDAQRQWALAISEEYQAVVNYNIGLASFELARGNILNYNKVIISEGNLPRCAEVRAVEHERERSKALVLRHRACPPLADVYEPGKNAMPAWPGSGAPSMPELLSKTPPLPTKLDAPATGPALGLIGTEPMRLPVALPPVIEVETVPGRLSAPVSERPAEVTAPGAVLGVPRAE